MLKEPKTKVHDNDGLTLEEYTVEQTRQEVQKMIDGARNKEFHSSGGLTPNQGLGLSPYFDLHLDSRGHPICNHSNVVKLLKEHPDWRGAFAVDEFSGKKKIFDPFL